MSSPNFHVGWVKFARASPDETQTEASRDATVTRFSRMTIAGIIVFLLIAFPSVAIGVLRWEPGFTWMNFPWPWLGVTLGGVMMSMFGIVALNEIRRSNGQIMGHGLAFFEIVFCPTLVVNGGIVGLLAWLARGNDIDLFPVLLGIIPLVLVNVLCLRKA